MCAPFPTSTGVQDTAALSGIHSSDLAVLTAYKFISEILVSIIRND